LCTEAVLKATQAKIGSNKEIAHITRPLHTVGSQAVDGSAPAC